jgi:hypothetical protein
MPSRQRKFCFASGSAERGVALARVPSESRQFIGEVNPRYLFTPVGMSLGRKVFRMIEKAER